MKVIKKSGEGTPLEEAHGGSGSRKLYIDDGQTPSGRIQGFTHGWLPAGRKFDMHNHADIEEVMYVLAGEGLVRDEDGEYKFKKGDVFIFPANVYHEIENKGSGDAQFIFIRVHA
jgi:mannose-6-phosphate isomerase-like protein (cupin superfamily)